MRKTIIKLSVVLIILNCIIMVYFTACRRYDRNIRNYMSSGADIEDYACEVMPELDELPDYKDIDYRYFKKRTIFLTETILLVVQYDKETYEKEKEKLDTSFTFLDHIVKDDFSHRLVMPEYEFSINQYVFRVIDDEPDSSIWYPKFFGMIATSDELNEIAYMYFADLDLDTIGIEGEGNPMQSFVKEYFKYSW